MPPRSLDREEILALFAQVPDSRRAAMLVHARRLVVTSHGFRVTQALAKMQDPRLVALLRVELTSVARREMSSRADAGDFDESGGGEEASRLRHLVAFFLGLGVGPEGQAVP